MDLFANVKFRKIPLYIHLHSWTHRFDAECIFGILYFICCRTVEQLSIISLGKHLSLPFHYLVGRFHHTHLNPKWCWCWFLNFPKISTTHPCTEFHWNTLLMKFIKHWRKLQGPRYVNMWNWALLMTLFGYYNNLIGIYCILILSFKDVFWKFS